MKINLEVNRKSVQLRRDNGRVNYHSFDRETRERPIYHSKCMAFN